MSKERLVVMNGQCLVQYEQGGAWKTNKVEKAGPIRPGLYNIHLSTQADKAAVYEGLIIHANKETVYQQVGKVFVKHPAGSFQKVPEIGSQLCISYPAGGGAAVIAAANPQKLGLGRSR